MIWLLCAVTVEFLIGSFGHLLPHLRVFLFVAFLSAWIVWALKNKTWIGWKQLVFKRKAWIFLAIVVAYGFVLGWIRGNHQFLIADGQRWLALLLLLPMLDVARNKKDDLRRLLPKAVLVGLIILATATLVFAFLFTHGFVSFNGTLYHWIRTSGLGEITPLGGNAFRIFLQSQVYAVLALIALIAWMGSHERVSKWAWILGALLGAETVLSLSRSFWIGLAAGLLIVVLNGAKRSRRTLSATVIVGFLSVILVAAVVPPSTYAMYIGARGTVTDSAAISRWQLLPVVWNKIKEHPILGSGFGATVTYQSKDPRVVAQTGGRDTTYAIEWGWLDHWIKFGLIGIPAVLAVLVSLIVRTRRSSLDEWIKTSLIASVIALALIHFFTPYLNHPLGLFALFLAEVVLEAA